MHIACWRSGRRKSARQKSGFHSHPCQRFKILRGHQNDMKMKGVSALLVLSLVALSFAQLSSTTSAISSLCAGLMQLLPVAAMLMVILASVIYAAGQMMGAETRARANVWATAAMTGALMGILITVVAQPVLTAIGGQSISCAVMCNGHPLQSGYTCCGSVACSPSQQCFDCHDGTPLSCGTVSPC